MNVDSPQKDIAIVAITRKGLALGRRLKALLPGSHLYLPGKFGKEQKPDEYSFSSPAREMVREVFHQYRHLVLIMAVGIAVRLVASEIRDKHTDPGVVVIDDYGSFSVSLLSGHEGGCQPASTEVSISSWCSSSRHNCVRSKWGNNLPSQEPSDWHWL